MENERRLIDKYLNLDLNLRKYISKYFDGPGSWNYLYGKQDYSTTRLITEFLEPKSIEKLMNDIFLQRTFEHKFNLFFEKDHPLMYWDPQKKYIRGISKIKFSEYNEVDNGFRNVRSEYFILQGIRKQIPKVKDELKTLYNYSKIEEINSTLHQWRIIITGLIKKLIGFDHHILFVGIKEMLDKLIQYSNSLSDSFRVDDSISKDVQVYIEKMVTYLDFKFKGPNNFLNDLFTNLKYANENVFVQGNKELFNTLLKRSFVKEENQGKIQFNCTSQAAAFLIAKIGGEFFEKLNIYSAGESGIFLTKSRDINNEPSARIFNSKNFEKAYQEFESSFNEATKIYSPRKKEKFKNDIKRLIKKHSKSTYSSQNKSHNPIGLNPFFPRA